MDSETSDLPAPKKLAKLPQIGVVFIFATKISQLSLLKKKKDCAAYGHCYINSQFGTIEMLF